MMDIGYCGLKEAMEREWMVCFQTPPPIVWQTIHFCKCHPVILVDNARLVFYTFYNLPSVSF